MRNRLSKLKFPKLDYLFVAMALSLFVISAIFRMGIPTEPRDKMIFDENYFVVQTESYMVNRYFYDPHGIFGRIPLLVGHILANPGYEEKLEPDKLADKSENGYQSPLNLDGIRFFPKLIGSLIPVLMFVLCYQLINHKRNKERAIANYLIPYLGGLAIAFENALILDSRIALLSQPMFAMMLLTLIAGIRYMRARTRSGTIWAFIFLVLCVGLTLGTKMVAYSVIPFALLMVIWKEYHSLENMRPVRRLAAGIITSLLIVYLGFLMYLGSFIWHFDQLHTYGPSAASALESYQKDLKEGTNETPFLAKYWDWQQRSLRYQQYVPELDYTKPDEIGSLWINWPINARPIQYWTEFTSGANATYAGLVTLGNPVVWALGLIGVLLLTGFGVARLLIGKNGFGWTHALVLALYFANWLPFAPIRRVMYIYHYYPALIFSVIAFTLFCYTFVVPRLAQVLPVLVSKIKTRAKIVLHNPLEVSTVIIFVSLLIAIVIGFYIYAPFTYKLPLNKDQFEARLIFYKEWNLKWPGK
ncbi:MAG: phospholipid carrier-dependent glycosyltransferase [Candidatus Doudnabacteria bacterium]|nr:phospholipid carrier-dependent glycosyltransferase [Candidatus Doudnabacteria bacterium]